VTHFIKLKFKNIFEKMGTCFAMPNVIKLEQGFNVKDMNELHMSKSDFIKFRKKDKFTEYYRLGKVIGKGAFCKVHKCQTLKGELVRAVKVISK